MTASKGQGVKSTRRRTQKRKRYSRTFEMGSWLQWVEEPRVLRPPFRKACSPGSRACENFVGGSDGSRDAVRPERIPCPGFLSNRPSFLLMFPSFSPLDPLAFGLRTSFRKYRSPFIYLGFKRYLPRIFFDRLWGSNRFDRFVGCTSVQCEPLPGNEG